MLLGGNMCFYNNLCFQVATSVSMVSVITTATADTLCVEIRMSWKAPWRPGCPLVKERARKAGRIRGGGMKWEGLSDMLLRWRK
jgi:hypothetical protein